jgi:hypothetical protein
MIKTTLMSVCMLMASGLASAGSFTVYGTGFSDTGTLLAAGSSDGNWTLESGPGASVPSPYAPFVTEGSTILFPSFPFGGATGWLPDTTSSKWISPDASEDSSNPASGAYYVYTETFVIPSTLSAGTAVITGQWSADNYGEILLNGVEVDPAAAIGSATLGAFETFVPFTIDAATGATFTTGTNTLTFEVGNNSKGSPDVTGLNVDVESATASAIPEPASLGLMGLGLAAIGIGARKWKRQ